MAVANDIVLLLFFQVGARGRRPPQLLGLWRRAGVQACAETCEGVDMADMDIDYCCLTNLRRQGAYAWNCATLADAAHTAGL